MEVRVGGLGDPQVEALLAFHHADARSVTPPENAHALDAVGLGAPEITLFTAWDGDTLLGTGALKRLGAGHGELKAMRTDPAQLRRGVARALLDRIVAAARAEGLTRLSLETGTASLFAPANALYELYGFTDCDAFGGYPASEHNRFMTLAL